jgi:hypothetical protein
MEDAAREDLASLVRLDRLGPALAAALDDTEQYWARKRLQLLNDASVGIGSTLDVAKAAEEFTNVVTAEFADAATVSILADVDDDSETGQPNGFRAPSGSPVRLRLMAQRPRTPDTREPDTVSDDVISYSAGSATAECLATGRGVLRAVYSLFRIIWRESTAGAPTTEGSGARG